VRCITSPVNAGSVAFHRRLGFEVVDAGGEQDGVRVSLDHAGPGQHRVLLRKSLPGAAAAPSIRAARPADKDRLLDIWLRSVRATHRFLGEDDIQALLPIVRDVALEQLELWALCDGGGDVVGFMGWPVPASKRCSSIRARPVAAAAACSSRMRGS
jgi:hypothetical protein